MDRKTEIALQKLNSRGILFGGWQRRRGAASLAGTEELDAVDALVGALDDPDPKVRTAARNSLTTLKGKAVDRFCGHWSQGRKDYLESILLECGYLASYPPYLHILTLLKLGRCSELQDTDNVGADVLLDARNDKYSAIAANAANVLISLKNEKTINYLCKRWAEGRESVLENVILKGSYVATHPIDLRYLTLLKQARVDEASKAGTEGLLLMIQFLKEKDRTVRENSKRALSSLQRAEAVNRFCELWGQSRDPMLEEILLKAGYVATTPPKLHCLTLLKQRRIEDAANADHKFFDFLMDFLKDRDQVVKESSRRALSFLQRQEAINRICELWEKTRDSVFEEIILKSGYVATAPPMLATLTLLKQGRVEEAANTDQQGVAELLKLRSDRDPVVRARALEALACLKRPEAVNHLCRTWGESRDSTLKDIILKAGYIASEPLEMHALTSFLNSKPLRAMLPGGVLKGCIFDKEAVVAGNAFSYAVAAKGRVETDWIMPFLVETFDLGLLQKLHAAGWHPAEAADRALFYFLAGDLGKYHDIDFEQKHLRYWYETAGLELKEAIAAGIRQSGQRRLLAVFRTERGGRKQSMSIAEVELQIEILIQKQDLEALFGLLPFATCEQGTRIIEALQAAGWQSPDSHNRALQDRLEELMKKQDQRRIPLSFAKKIYQDFRPMFLKDEKPPGDTAALNAWLSDTGRFRRRSAALISMAEGNTDGLKEAANHACRDAYWQVRMAAAACELLHPGTLSAENIALLEKDHVYWVQALLKMPAGASRLVELDPSGLAKLRQCIYRPDPKVKPEGPDDFFDLLQCLGLYPEAEYLLTLAEFLGTDVDVSDETAYDAAVTDIEIEVEK